MTLGAGAGTPGPGVGGFETGRWGPDTRETIGLPLPRPGPAGHCERTGGGSGGGWGGVRSCQARREPAPMLAAFRPAFGTPLTPHAPPGGPFPRAASQGAAWPPCLDRGKGWRWGRDAGLWAGRGAAMPAMPGACLSLCPSPRWGHRLQQTPASPRRGLEDWAAIAAIAAAAVACAAETRLEMGADKNPEEDSISRICDTPGPDDSWSTSASQDLDFGTKLQVRRVTF
ncbi:uncharacterized protein LOC125159862 isoform X2 [Prionailurus viverrinus]|uniref:uncharacterized protein LOC125159862 isoform X2 n=1 Tax=Prionailurus viverrinus TaxID=61388 RepID=UPI001FF2A938|nr:uncharacterized protein LOC125159862 isoform X2 [Prionailurus viverrinus]